MLSPIMRNELRSDELVRECHVPVDVDLFIEPPHKRTLSRDYSRHVALLFVADLWYAPVARARRTEEFARIDTMDLLGQGESLLEGMDLPALGYSVKEHVSTGAAMHLMVGRTPTNTAP
jgi:hypothetical protein